MGWAEARDLSTSSPRRPGSRPAERHPDSSRGVSPIAEKCSNHRVKRRASLERHGLAHGTDAKQS